LPSAVDVYRKWVIFWTVSFVFLILEAVLCFFQIKIVKRDASNGLIGENELPDVLMVMLDFGSSVLLIVSIQRFRRISNENPGLEESKMAIFLHLTLFSIETFFIIGFVTFQFVYIKTEDFKFFTTASWMHVVA
jgi:heme/copper-type cytochrome/quinol oxidase subunit 2